LNNKERFEDFLRRADEDATADATAYLADLRAKRSRRQPRK
jgi:hypothetical protein